MLLMQIMCSTLCCHQSPKRGRLKKYFHPYYVLMIVNNTTSILTYVLSTADKSYAHVLVFLEDLVSHFQGIELKVSGRICPLCVGRYYQTPVGTTAGLLPALPCVPAVYKNLFCRRVALPGPPGSTVRTALPPPSGTTACQRPVVPRPSGA